MSKAFDFMNHQLLLNKLDRYGIRGTALNWIQSYLTNRQQCVQISRIENNSKKYYTSEFLTNKCGVPQGSVLGPLLFLLYINDLPNVTEQNCILFADDTTLIIKCKTKNEMQLTAKTEFDKIMTWLKNNNLNINLDKTKYIQFKTINSTNTEIDINYQNTTGVIENVNTTKFLGIQIDNYLNWKAQINGIVAKLDRFVYALNRIRQIASKTAALQAYHGYVASVLRYGVILWGNSVDTIKAFKAQKKCIRSVCGAGYLDSCKPLFKALNVLPLPCLYIFEMGIFVKKYQNLFASNKDYEYRGRRDNDLRIPSQRLKLYSQNAYCMAIRIYNKLPRDIKTLTLYKFKNKLFTFLMEKMYYSVKDFLEDKIV